jgi:hypothetical protein
VRYWKIQVIFISLRIEYKRSVIIWSLYTKAGRGFAELSVYTALDFISGVCNSLYAVEVNPERNVSPDICD